MTTPDEAATLDHDGATAPDPAGPAVAAMIDVTFIRELAVVTDQLKAREGEIEDLKARKVALSKKILEFFELHGLEDMRVDGRKAYVHRATGAKYKEKPVEEGGGKYGPTDVLDVLREIGRGAQIKPETVNWQTMGAILRELSDTEEGVPEALAKFVELGESVEIRVGPPRK